MVAKIIKSNLGYDEVSLALLDTYRKWVNFALGKESIGGKVLKYPSGRYAAAITAKKDEKGNIIGIYIDDSAEGALEARIIEHGHRKVALKDYMLRGAKVSSEGYRYRRLNLRQAPLSPMRALAQVAVGGGFVSRGPKHSLRSFSRSMGQIWSENYKSAYGDNWRTMTDKPGSAKWEIPSMPAYSPARILKELLDEKFGPRASLRIKIP